MLLIKVYEWKKLMKGGRTYKIDKNNAFSGDTMFN